MGPTRSSNRGLPWVRGQTLLVTLARACPLWAWGRRDSGWSGPASPFRLSDQLASPAATPAPALPNVPGGDPPLAVAEPRAGHTQGTWYIAGRDPAPGGRPGHAVTLSLEAQSCGCSPHTPPMTAPRPPGPLRVNPHGPWAPAGGQSRWPLSQRPGRDVGAQPEWQGGESLCSPVLALKRSRHGS